MNDSKNRTPLWLDCDPGHDDAFAILLAAHHPSLNLLGISTVHGNVSLDKTTVNASRILTAVGRADVLVYPGAARPFCRNAVHAVDIHGTTGLDGTDLIPEATSSPVRDVSAIVAMHAALLAQPEGTAWLVATGTLTNVALLFTVFPDLVGHVKGLSIMGGAIGGGFSNAPIGYVDGEGERIGNWTRWAEFNIYCDPEAAQAIFSNQALAAKTTLTPIDLTHQVLATQEIQMRLLQGAMAPPTKIPESDMTILASTLRPMLHELVMFFASTYADVYGLTSGPPLHDPIAVAAILFDQPFDDLGFDDGQGERWHVRVVTDGLHSNSSDQRGQVGRTIATIAPLQKGGVRIPRSLNVESFWKMVEDCIQRAEKVLSRSSSTV